MAKVHLHPFLTQLHGAFGNVVFRRYRGSLVPQRKPTFTQPRSEGQKVTEGRFSFGNAFAARLKDQPELLERYRQQGRARQLNYRHMAIADALHPPEITGIDVAAFSPAAGGVMEIDARDDFEVFRVTVALRSPSGEVLAQGEAKLEGATWKFLAPALPAGGEARIEVSAEDRPGNVTRRVFDLSGRGL